MNNISPTAFIFLIKKKMDLFKKKKSRSRLTLFSHQCPGHHSDAEAKNDKHLKPPAAHSGQSVLCACRGEKAVPLNGRFIVL